MTELEAKPEAKRSSLNFTASRTDLENAGERSAENITCPLSYIALLFRIECSTNN
jgi:hypothetical protein